MIDSAVVTCPNCEFDFDVTSDIFSDIFNVESAAEHLLEKYQGGHPSTGDVQRLKDRLTEILVSEFNVSIGAI